MYTQITYIYHIVYTDMPTYITQHTYYMPHRSCMLLICIGISHISFIRYAHPYLYTTYITQITDLHMHTVYFYHVIDTYIYNIHSHTTYTPQAYPHTHTHDACTYILIRHITHTSHTSYNIFTSQTYTHHIHSGNRYLCYIHVHTYHICIQAFIYYT